MMEDLEDSVPGNLQARSRLASPVWLRGTLWSVSVRTTPWWFGLVEGGGFPLLHFVNSREAEALALPAARKFPSTATRVGQHSPSNARLQLRVQSYGARVGKNWFRVFWSMLPTSVFFNKHNPMVFYISIYTLIYNKQTKQPLIFQLPLPTGNHLSLWSEHVELLLQDRKCFELLVNCVRVKIEPPGIGPQVLVHVSTKVLIFDHHCLQFS